MTTSDKMQVSVYYPKTLRL